MKIVHTTVLALAAAATLGACSSMSASPGTSATGDDSTTAVVLIPNVAGANAALQSGCWATFFDERNFGGDSLTMVGPVELQSLDKGTARQLKRDIKSVVTGPRATLLLYEKQLFSARSVGFTPDSREGSLIEKLGFGGRIESVRLQCS